MISIKRIYDSRNETEGLRVLVDRIWPRGITKQEANLHLWMKEIAPSTELRKSFCHDPEKFLDFKVKYIEELKQHQEEIVKLINFAETNNLMLLFGAKDEVHNQAVVLKEYLEELIANKDNSLF